MLSFVATDLGYIWSHTVIETPLVFAYRILSLKDQRSTLGKVKPQNTCDSLGSDVKMHMTSFLRVGS